MNFRYSGTARFLHWITAGLMVAIVALGIWIVSYTPQDEALKFRLYNIHQSLGFTLFIIVLIRLFVRFTNPPAPLPSHVPPLIRTAASLNHFGLYVVLLAQPVIGFLGTNAWGFPLKWFELVTIPSPIGRQADEIAKAFTNAHWVGAALLGTLFLMHVGGVAYHALIRRDGVADRML